MPGHPDALFTQTAAETALWPLRIWADGGIASIECAECDSGQDLMAGRVDRPFMIADLTARVEEHIPKCRRSR